MAGFLAHNDPSYRHVAISVLSGHWDRGRYADVFQTMTLTDPDDDVRQIALSSVGYLRRSTKDVGTARFLLSIFQDTAQDPSMRQTAYEGLVEGWQGGDAWLAVIRKIIEAERRSPGLKRDKIWESVVNWDFVRLVEGQVRNRP